MYMAIKYIHESKGYPIERLCKKANLNRSSYYKWLKRNKTFHAKLTERNMIQSMSRVGRCIDNGPMEGFWGILKSEMYYLKKFTDKETLVQAIENYIYLYNNKRDQLKLHCMTPMEYHAAFAA